LKAKGAGEAREGERERGERRQPHDVMRPSSEPAKQSPTPTPLSLSETEGEEANEGEG
jgi:hypothetical protein